MTTEFNLAELMKMRGERVVHPIGVEPVFCWFTSSLIFANCHELLPRVIRYYHCHYKALLASIGTDRLIFLCGFVR